MESDLTDEDYVIHRAKQDLLLNPSSAKAWMLTAKTLYPNNYNVQFEAYLIEKNAANVKEAAKCFSQLLTKFQKKPEFWKEVEKLTTALRAENDMNEADKQFLCEMFRHISSEVQHKLLLYTADHCEDTMEHCRSLLLLLQRFPTTIASYAPRLLDTLIAAEKHSVDAHFAVNSYRKLLVCDLLPLLAKENVQIELSQKLLYKLLNKSIDFYLYYLGVPSSQDLDSKMEDSWKKLFAIIEFIGTQLKWDPFLISFKNNWSKESYWQKLVTGTQANQQALSICLSIFFIYCLYEYNLSLVPESSPGQTQTVFVLTEAFVDPTLANPISESKPKKRKSEGDSALLPFMSVEKPEYKNIYSNFTMCVNCWDLMHSMEFVQKEFVKINSRLKLDSWLSGFVIDYALYKAQYDEALIYLEKINDSALLLNRYVRIAGIHYSKKNYCACLENVVMAISLLPTNNIGTVSTQLIIGGSQRHLHYLPLTRLAVLQYLVKLLLRSIKQNILNHNLKDLAIGHIFALVQLDWPQEEDYVPHLMEQIQQNGSFQYHLFQNYIINVDILEEITYLCTVHGGQIHLNILPHLGQRRIGTRGSDKGAKEEIKLAIRRQVARTNESIDELLIKFITQETAQILQVL